MKALKLELYQNMTNYRREMSYGYVQTYPLPTPSMVKGMAHSLLGLNKFENLTISIQGNFKSIVTNMQKVIKFDRGQDRPNNPYKLFIGNSSSPKTALHGVMFVDEVVDINLLLHIAFEDESLTRKLMNAVKEKTVILGRNEDIARVDYKKTKIVSIKKEESDEYELMYNIFAPKQFIKDTHLSGTHYRLPFYYQPVSDFSDKRIFKFVDTVYVVKGRMLDDDAEITVDEENDIVAFLGVDNFD